MRPLSRDLPPTMKLSAFLSVDSSSLSLSSTVMSSLSVDLLDGDKRVSLSRWLSRRKSNRKFHGSRTLRKDGSKQRMAFTEAVQVKGVKAAKARCKKTLVYGKDLSQFQTMWSIKQQDLALKERISKMKLLDSLIAKEGPLEDYEEALKKKLINELMSN
ncbi:hypothetical protein F2Q69_00024313 [Brassica cretica]|uniref:No apical meristem-associated C-terminal domain-containing protein n=1 Tax=Brassica cretica TaxID=69181 RepID=A0A8S9QE05_BRACR|nr:hypothetical protein F2Q69_00024313 [Brassica cretica]